jgi:cytochrome c-type biogenesis protein CcmH
MDFSLLLGLLFLAVGPFILYPFVTGDRANNASAAKAKEANIAIFREQEAQLQKQLDNGEINPSDFDQLVADAQQLLLNNTEARLSTEVATKSALGLWLLPLLLLAIPLLSLLTYERLGAGPDEEIRQLMDEGAQFAPNTPAFLNWRAKLDQAVAQRVEQRPENMYYWALLAQSAIAEGDLVSASQYFAAALEVQPEDGFLLAQYAETLFLVAGNRFTPEVEAAMDRAFVVDSNNPTILGLKGIQAFERQQLSLAITYWQGARQGLDPNSPTSQALLTGIERANSLLGQPTNQPQTSELTSVQILVSLDPRITFTEDQQVFVAAVRPTGAPMPLAAKKLSVAELPALVTLSDRDSLMPGQNLSSVSSFKLVARLSNSGSATPQSGDWEALSEEIESGSLDGQIELLISRQRP